MNYRKGLKAFRLEVVDGLVATTYINKKHKSSSGSAGLSVKISKHKPHTPIEVRKLESAHQPRRGTRRRCASCSTKAKQVRTDWECSVCNVPLCLGKQKSCFQNYHK